MKYIWTAEDVNPGQIVCKNTKNPNPSIEYISSYCFKIGYLAAGNPNRPYTNKELDKRADYCLIAINDGMIGTPMTKQEMAEYLTKDDLMLCPHNRLIKIMDYLRDAY